MGPDGHRCASTVRAAAAWLGLTLSTAAAAGNSGAPDADIEIGGITTYASEGEARAACGKDPVVWADRHAGYVFFPREGEYGTTAEGAFACLHDALRGNYWDTGPLSGMEGGHGPGRVFPYRPLPDTPLLTS